MVLVMKLVAIVLDEVCVIMAQVFALVSMAITVQNVNSKQFWVKYQFR
jgi:hypothetical protein